MIQKCSICKSLQNSLRCIFFSQRFFTFYGKKEIFYTKKITTYMCGYIAFLFFYYVYFQNLEMNLLWDTK